MRMLTSTINAKLHLTVESGTCRVAFCKPIVLSKIVPHQCLDEQNGGKLVNASAEMSFVLKDGNKDFGCTMVRIPCHDGTGGDQPAFRMTDDEYLNADHLNSLEYGRSLKAGQSIASLSGVFRLTLAQSEELRLLKQEKLIRSSDVRSFADYESRARLKSNGQLVVEVNRLKEPAAEYAASKCSSGSIFSQAEKLYRCAEEDWKVVWSSAPIQHSSVQIGLGTCPGEQVAYKLVLSDAGE